MGTQIPHAVGAALASRIRGEDAVAIAYFGDGATSKADFHEAANFAAIHALPAIFFCENNGYAISVPTRSQIAGGGVAERAGAYGIPGERVDGMDLLAVYAASARLHSGDPPSTAVA